MKLRDKAQAAIADEGYHAVESSHQRGLEKLHVRRDGTLWWGEYINGWDDTIDYEAGGFAAVPSLLLVGTGSVRCTCSACADGEWEGPLDDEQAHLEDEASRKLAAIPHGYFYDEQAATPLVCQVPVSAFDADYAMVYRDGKLDYDAHDRLLTMLGYKYDANMPCRCEDGGEYGHLPTCGWRKERP